MIIGEFDDWGRPYVEGLVIIPRLNVREVVTFLLDTGADGTCLHPRDARRARMPFNQLENRTTSKGIGGSSSYFREPAILAFADKPQTRFYGLELSIAEPHKSNEELPSLLGRDVINHWYMQYDPAVTKLECTVRYADHTLAAT